MTKASVLEELRKLLSEKKQDLQEMMQDVRNGLADDTKSSAGDKYETSREMSNQELEKIARQLTEINRQLALLHQLEESYTGSYIAAGALVLTSGGYFLLGVPAGAIQVSSETVYCLSASAPLALALMKRQAGEAVSFNGKTLEIQAIF